jgi:hypothetical protein
MEKKSPRKIAIALSVILFFSIQAFAQTNSKTINYSKYPYWIDMMNDPNVNYFEAVKAYDEFWKDRKKPEEEDDIIGPKKSGTDKHNFFKKREEREEAESQKYAFDVKKFEHWKLMVKPYVQEDGRILTADEKLKLWEQQQQQ